MTLRAAALACALAGANLAAAQQPAPPAPAFAAPNLADKGVQSMAANCASCHGTHGRPAQGASLSGLAGRPKDELVQIMGQFKAGQRPATIMHQIAKGYGEAEIAALAEYFSRQPR